MTHSAQARPRTGTVEACAKTGHNAGQKAIAPKRPKTTTGYSRTTTPTSPPTRPDAISEERRQIHFVPEHKVPYQPDMHRQGCCDGLWGSTWSRSRLRFLMPQPAWPVRPQKRFGRLGPCGCCGLHQRAEADLSVPIRLVIVSGPLRPDGRPDKGMVSGFPRSATGLSPVALLVFTPIAARARIIAPELWPLPACLHRFQKVARTRHVARLSLQARIRLPFIVELEPEPQ